MKKKILMFCIIFILSIGFLAVKKAEAGSGDNVYGWAWSENIGWISFNNTTGGGAISYGVNVDSFTGNFSGYAWADTIGWISFNRSKTGTPPAAPYNGAETFIARLDLGTNEVSGWARALSACQNNLWDSVNERCTGNGAGDAAGGWDGWIKLGGTWVNGVSLDTTPVPPDPDEFEGWAWGSDVVGWISFNRTNCDPDKNGQSNGIGNCPSAGTAISNYKVMTDLNINPVPSANNLSKTEGNYCNCVIGQITKCSGSKSQPPIYLNWTFNDPGDTQSAYQIEIHKNSSFTSLAIDSGKVPTLSPSGPDYSYTPPNLEFNNTQYWWRLKVWDDGVPAAESIWINAPASFTTAAHRWPNTDFTPNPTNPPPGVEVTFIDNSKCYTAAGGEYNCKTGAGVSYNWDFDYDPAEGFTIDATTKGDTTHTYAVSGNYIVRLEVTDSMCPCVFPLTAALPLPTWKEIAPF